MEIHRSIAQTGIIEACNVVSEDDQTLIRFVVPRLPIALYLNIALYHVSVEMLITNGWKQIIEYPGISEVTICIHHSFRLFNIHLHAKQLVASGVENWRNGPSRLAILRHCPIQTLC